MGLDPAPWFHHRTRNCLTDLHVSQTDRQRAQGGGLVEGSRGATTRSHGCRLDTWECWLQSSLAQ